jgi:DNA invertase Pin-like site-specific DNA recombinase
MAGVCQRRGYPGGDTIGSFSAFHASFVPNCSRADKKLNPQQVAELQERREQGVLIKMLMQDYDLSKSSVYRYLNQEAEVVKE